MVRIVGRYLPVWVYFLYTVGIIITKISKNRNCPLSSVSIVNMLDVLQSCKRLCRSSVICFQTTQESSTYLDHKDVLSTALLIAVYEVCVTDRRRQRPSHCYPLVLLTEFVTELDIRGRRTNFRQLHNRVHIQSRAFIHISIIFLFVFYHWNVGKLICDVRTYHEIWLLHLYAVNSLKCREMVFPANEVIKNVDWSSCKVPVIVVRF
jgi:hypothetical protein